MVFYEIIHRRLMDDSKFITKLSGGSAELLTKVKSDAAHSIYHAIGIAIRLEILNDEVAEIINNKFLKLPIRHMCSNELGR